MWPPLVSLRNPKHGNPTLRKQKHPSAKAASLNFKALRHPGARVPQSLPTKQPLQPGPQNKTESCNFVAEIMHLVHTLATLAASTSGLLERFLLLMVSPKMDWRTHC